MEEIKYHYINLLMWYDDLTQPEAESRVNDYMKVNETFLKYSKPVSTNKRSDEYIQEKTD